MALLKLNGWTIEVTPRRASEDYLQLGDGAEDGEAFDGSALGIRTATKREWPLRSTALLPMEARALRGLIHGEGEYWSFDVHAWSSKGLNATSGDGTITSDAKFGNAMHVTEALVYEVEILAPWTIMTWRGATNGSVSWVHYGIRSDGAKWVDGTRNDSASTGWISLSGGNLTLSAGNAFDDLVVLPYLAPDAQIQAVEDRGRAHSRLPRIEIEGELLDTGMSEVVQVLGEESRASVKSFGRDDDWIKGGREYVQFVLREV